MSSYAETIVRNPFGASVLLCDETSSTMDDARVFSERGAVHGTVIRACAQTGGRGRFRDRAWLNEAGRDLQFTIILDAASVMTRALPLSCGLALLRAVSPIAAGSGAALRLKWPNDLMAGGKKISGILCESSGGRYYAGIGVNCLKKTFPPEIAGKAASLEEVAGHFVDMDALLSSILDELHRVVSAPFRPEELTGLFYGEGSAVRFLEGLPEDGAIIEGMIQGVGEGGELLLKLPSGEVRSCASGELLVY